MESVTALGGGRVEVSIRVKERRWVERLLIRLGGAATVLEPADLIDDVRRTARDALANYS